MALPLTKEKAFYIVFILILLNIYFAFIDEFYSIDTCYAEFIDKSANASLLDKYTQTLFFSVYFVAFMTIPFPKMDKDSFSSLAKRLLEFFISYLFRYTIYLLLVQPVGDVLPYKACLTQKSISGHTHMYSFHTGLNFYYFCMYLTNKNKNNKNNVSKYRITWLIKDIYSTISTIIFMATLIIGTASISKTYYGGYHSPRHMIQGFIVAIESIVSYILFRKIILEKSNWVEQFESNDFFIK